jgi:predicted N-acyltransferase
MLMVGCMAGEGDLGLLAHGEDDAEVTKSLCEAFAMVARQHGRSLITFKDFPTRYRRAFSESADAGYAALPSFPSTLLPLDFENFEAFLRHRLGKATRKDLRRKFRKIASGPPITMEVRSDIAAQADELHALYCQVLERSEFRFEELTADYLRQLGAQMPDRVRFFIWRIDGRPVAFSVCMVHDNRLYDMYLGLDYAIALERHLYFVTLRDLLTWGIEQGLSSYYSTPLNYDPKLRLRFELAPLDLYVRHASRWLNPVFRRIVPWLGPTRYDRFLPHFPNAADLPIPPRPPQRFAPEPLPTTR